MHNKVIALVLIFVFSVSLCPVAYSSDAVATQADGQYIPVKPALGDFEGQTASNVLPQQTFESHFNHASPLSLPDSAVNTSIETSESTLISSDIISNFSNAALLPEEQPFLTQTGTGVYEMKFDMYMKELLNELLPTNATSGFTPLELVNVELAAIRQRIQEGLAGVYDFVVIVPTEQARNQLHNFSLVAPDGVQGFGAPEKDNIDGIGLPEDDPRVIELNETFGPIFEKLFSHFSAALKAETSLQGTAWIDLNAIAEQGLSTVGYQTFVLLQEMAHRWGTYLSSAGAIDHNPLGILGRDNSHWSAFFDAGTSPMDGLDWRDNGNGTFTLQSFFGIRLSDLFANPTNPSQSNQFNDFDLYAMGILSPQSVQSSFVIDSPISNGTSLNSENFFDRLSDINFLINPTISGTRRNISIDQILEIEGPRNPSSALSQKDFKVAFVMLRDENEAQASFQSTMNQVLNLSNLLPVQWQTATKTLSTMTFGTNSSSIEAFRSKAADVYDQIISLLHNQRSSSFNSAKTTAQLASALLSGLESDLTEVETLLAQLVQAGKSIPEIKQQLGTLPSQVQDQKKVIEDLRLWIDSLMSESASLGSTFSSFRNQFLVKLTQISTSGLLPLGLGADADTKLELLDSLYVRLTDQLTESSSNINSQSGGIQNFLNQTMDSLNEIALNSPNELKVKADSLLSLVLADLSNVSTQQNKAHVDLNKFTERKSNLLARLNAVKSTLDEIALAPYLELKAKITELEQFQISSEPIDFEYDSAVLELNGIKSNLLLLIDLLTKIISGEKALTDLPQAIQQYNALKSQQVSQNHQQKVDQKLQTIESSVGLFETVSQNLTTEITQNLSQVLTSFLDFTGLSLDELISLFETAENLEDSLAESENKMSGKKSQILDSTIQQQITGELAALSNSFSSHKNEINTKQVQITGLQTIKSQLMGRKTEIDQLKAWLMSDLFLTVDPISFANQFSQLAAIKQSLSSDEVQNLEEHISLFKTESQALIQALNGLDDEFQNLESEINEILNEQASQVAEEENLKNRAQELKTNFDDLENQFAATKEIIINKITMLLEFNESLNQAIEMLKPIAVDLNKWINQKNSVLNSINQLNQTISQLPSEFAKIQTALNELDLAILKMNNMHTLLNLREAKEFLSLVEQAFIKTEIVTDLDSQANFLTNENQNIKNGLRNEFLILSKELENHFDQFLDEHELQIESFKNQVDTSSKEYQNLLAKFESLSNELFLTGESQLKEENLALAKEVENDLSEQNSLLEDANVLIPKLNPTLQPLMSQVALLKQNIGIVENGELYTSNMIQKFIESETLLASFSSLTNDHPLEQMKKWNDQEVLKKMTQKIGQIDVFLHPPINKTNNLDSTFFDIPAIQGYPIQESSFYNLKSFRSFNEIVISYGLFGPINPLISRHVLEKNKFNQEYTEKNQRRLNRLFTFPKRRKKVRRELAADRQLVKTDVISLEATNSSAFTKAANP